jgi:hypothetical protein
MSGEIDRGISGGPVKADGLLGMVNVAHPLPRIV